MIRSFMSPNELARYVKVHSQALQNRLITLDRSWKNSLIIENLLKNAETTLHSMAPINNVIPDPSIVRDRKTEKYTDWVEVMRLASFQYERFSQRQRAKSEGLYATLLALASTWGSKQKFQRILIPGCGPGRSVLDFARAFPTTQVDGLDYSVLSLILGDQIVCSSNETQLLRRDVHSQEDISQILTISGFGLNNANFYLCDLVTFDLPLCDMIVCSNTLNLLPNHYASSQKISNTLRPGGLLIFADLVGWRLDREPKRRILRNNQTIRDTFESFGMITLDMFDGVPYIESESDDQNTIYNEHFYVARKR